MFTENCRDAFRTPRWGRSLLRGIYEKTRAPLCPIYGGFPVKMITHLGKPIYFNQNEVSPEQVKHTVQSLIREHQRLPGSIIRGIYQRFFPKRKSKEGALLLADHNRGLTHTNEAIPVVNLSPNHKHELASLNTEEENLQVPEPSWDGPLEERDEPESVVGGIFS